MNFNIGTSASRAAAAASVPQIKGGVCLDCYDAKLVHNKYAVLKLEEIISCLKRLQDICSQASTDTEIVPLVIFIAGLFGPVANVNEILEKRLMLVKDYKLVKLTEVNAALSTVPVSLELDDADLFPEYYEKFYDTTASNRLLLCLIKIAENLMVIYEQREKQLMMERSAHRPNDISGQPPMLDYAEIEDLIQPLESKLVSELAVAIKDREKDTERVAFGKINLEVLKKLYLKQSELMKTIKEYALELKNFHRKSAQPRSIMGLTNWRYTIHRILCCLIKLNDIYVIMRYFARFAYLSNRDVFHRDATRLCSLNVAEYDIFLKDIESQLDGELQNNHILEHVHNLSRQGTFHHVQATNIVSLSTALVASVTTVNKLMSLVNNWIVKWSYFQQNMSTLRDLSDDEIAKALSDKLAADTVVYEKQQADKEAAKKANSMTKISESTSPASIGTADSISAPALSRSASVGSQSSFNSPSRSPQISRSPSTLSRSSSTVGKQTNGLNKSPGVNKTLLKQPGPLAKQAASKAPAIRSPATTAVNMARSPGSANKLTSIGQVPTLRRPRSSSLQAAQPKPVVEIQRTNSLQDKAEVAQRKIQSRMARLSVRGTGSATSSTNSSRNRSPLRKSPMMSRDTSRDVSPLRSKSSEEIPSPELVLEEGIKKVRFMGIPPLQPEPSPTKQGWYKKPAVLHYPPPPVFNAPGTYKMAASSGGRYMAASADEVGSLRGGLIDKPSKSSFLGALRRIR